MMTSNSPRSTVPRMLTAICAPASMSRVSLPSSFSATTVLAQLSTIRHVRLTPWSSSSRSRTSQLSLNSVMPMLSRTSPRKMMSRSLHSLPLTLTSRLTLMLPVRCATNSLSVLSLIKTILPRSTVSPLLVSSCVATSTMVMLYSLVNSVLRTLLLSSLILSRVSLSLWSVKSDLRPTKSTLSVASTLCGFSSTTMTRPRLP
mmetsp:Transcript_9523/g.17306  ORF Transcript_9523/g.17306 Transcript_9523/m.17306 type:complete len:202 (-) Transcript_9523:746-1351(-)